MMRMHTILFYVFMVLLLCTACNSPEKERETTLAVSNDTMPVPGAAQNLPQERIAKAYIQAITEYIKAVYPKDKPLPDTLFILKHAEFPDIILPATMEQAHIRLLTTQEAEQKLRHRPSSVALNIIGWIDKDQADFTIVTFWDGFKPQYNCILSLKYHVERNDFYLDRMRFEYPY